MRWGQVLPPPCLTAQHTRWEELCGGQGQAGEMEAGGAGQGAGLIGAKSVT